MPVRRSLTLRNQHEARWARDEFVWRDVVAAVDGGAPVSIALGELAEWDARSVHGDGHATGVAWFKLGLAGERSCSDWANRLLDVRNRLKSAWSARGSTAAPGCIAVVYADSEAARPPKPMTSSIEPSQTTARVS